MPPSFVIEFASLLLLGPNATMLVAMAGTVTQGLTDSDRSDPLRRMLVNAATAHGCDTGRGRITPGARWHDGPLRVAVAGRADRGRCCRVLLRQERFGGDHRAALHETADQSIVAEEPSPGLSELLHRGQPRGGTRRGDRPPDVGSPAGGSRSAVFRLPRVLRPREPARRRAPPSGGHRIAGSGHVRRRQQWPGHALERCPRTHPGLSPRASAGPFTRRRRCQPWPRPSFRERSASLDESDPPDARASRAASGSGRADSAGQNSPRCRWRDAALA